MRGGAPYADTENLANVDLRWPLVFQGATRLKVGAPVSAYGACDSLVPEGCSRLFARSVKIDHSSNSVSLRHVVVAVEVVHRQESSPQDASDQQRREDLGGATKELGDADDEEREQVRQEPLRNQSDLQEP